MPPKTDQTAAAEPVKSIEERLLDIQERQLAIQEQAVGVQKQQLKQTKRRSNDVGPDISPFNPRGQKDYPMPELKCEILAPWPMKPGLHGLDREEVELFNLLEPGVYTIDMTDGTQRRASVVAAKNTVTGTIEQMALAGAYDPDTRQHAALFTKEDKQLFPSMKIMLRQMLDQQGADYAGVMTMREEARRIALPEGDDKKLLVSVGE
jgi:hypothetical protein